MCHDRKGLEILKHKTMPWHCCCGCCLWTKLVAPQEDLRIISAGHESSSACAGNLFCIYISRKGCANGSVDRSRKFVKLCKHTTPYPLLTCVAKGRSGAPLSGVRGTGPNGLVLCVRIAILLLICCSCLKLRYACLDMTGGVVSK